MSEPTLYEKAAEISVWLALTTHKSFTPVYIMQKGGEKLVSLIYDVVCKDSFRLRVHHDYEIKI